MKNEDVIHVTDSGQILVSKILHGSMHVRRPEELEILTYLHQPGEATVEELGMNLKMRDVVLEKALKQLLLDELVYLIPFHPHPSTFSSSTMESRYQKGLGAQSKRVDIAISKTLKLGSKTKEIPLKEEERSGWASHAWQMYDEAEKEKVRTESPERKRLEDMQDKHFRGEYY